MPANVTYNSIKVGGTSVAISGATKASFVEGFNNIEVKFTSDVSLRTFMIRVSSVDEDFDLEIGTCPVFLTNVAANTLTTTNVPINSTYFNKGDVDYIVALYSQSSVDGLWDVTCLFMTLTAEGATTHQVFAPNGSDGMEVKTSKDI